jgi:hypothetical protein
MAGGFDVAAYDVVLLCPYIHKAVRDRIVSRLAELNPPPSIIEIRETASGHRIALLNSSDGSRPAPVEDLITALSARQPPEQ